MRIAVLEDDRDQSNLLLAWLSQAGYQCSVFDDGGEFIRAYARDSYDIVLLDWMVPNTDGFEVLQHLRNHFEENVPVIFISQRNTEEDIVDALQNGADDYMIKPLKEKETLARIAAIARRLGFGELSSQNQYDYSPYTINVKKRQICYNGQLVEMTQREYELTVFLFKNIGRVISRGHLLELVWGTSSKINTRTVDTHISRLRSKLNLDNEPDWKLTSIYRHGYRLEKIET